MTPSNGQKPSNSAQSPQEPVSSGRISASLGRRVGALCTDWILCLAIATITTPKVGGAKQFMPLVIFFLEVLAFTLLMQASAGQRICGIKVVDSRTGYIPTFSQVLVRTILIVLFIPPLLTINGVGLHDRVTHTTTVMVSE